MRQFGAWIATSESMGEIFDRLRTLAASRRPVLLQGEPGIGKRDLARELHAAGADRDAPLVVVGCGAIPRPLEAAELFGNGSSSPGAFERARGGSLILDDLPELPLPLQDAIAGHLQAGGVRLISTAERDVERETQGGRFSAQLWRQLVDGHLTIPPLRARREDIALLAAHFAAIAAQRPNGGSRDGLSAMALGLLEQHDWPGNSRELRNVVERAVRGLGASAVAAVDTSPAGSSRVSAIEFVVGESYRETRTRFESDFERAYVAWLLERHAGNISAASREARMDRKYLYDLARKHGLRGSRRRQAS